MDMSVICLWTDANQLFFGEPMMVRYLTLVLVLLAQPALAGQWPHYADGTVFCFDKLRANKVPLRLPLAEAIERCDPTQTFGSSYRKILPPMDGWYDPVTGQITQQAPWDNLAKPHSEDWWPMSPRCEEWYRRPEFYCGNEYCGMDCPPG